MKAISDRQWQLINLAADGSTDKEIAVVMNISIGTVRTYWDRLRRRYDCKNRSEVIVKTLFKKVNEEFKENMLNALPLFIWKTDAKGLVNFRNEWFSNSTHPGQSAVPASIIAFVAQEEREQVSSELAQALKSGKRFEKVATFELGPSRQRKPHKITMTPLKSQTDKIDFWIGYGREMAVDADEQMLRFLTKFMS